MEHTQLLNAEQTSIVLGVSEWTVREMARRNMLPHLRPNRRTLRFDAEQLFMFFAEKEGRCNDHI
jgi:excisionase family DNA binding protein